MTTNIFIFRSAIRNLHSAISYPVHPRSNPLLVSCCFGNFVRRSDSTHYRRWAHGDYFPAFQSATRFSRRVVSALSALPRWIA